MQNILKAQGAQLQKESSGKHNEPGDSTILPAVDGLQGAVFQVLKEAVGVLFSSQRSDPSRITGLSGNPESLKACYFVSSTGSFVR